MAEPGTVHVSCYAGYRGAETPRRLVFGERAVDVVDVLDRWITPDHRYFKCLCSDGDIYIVRHDTARDCWELTMFQRGSAKLGSR